MRNIRQFMNGMKNYLVKHGEKDFGVEVDKARAGLKHDEFLNLDQILEGVMHQLIVLPLKEHLYELFVDYYGSRGDIEQIISNMKFAENKDPVAFGVKVSSIESSLVWSGWSGAVYWLTAYEFKKFESLILQLSWKAY